MIPQNGKMSRGFNILNEIFSESCGPLSIQFLCVTLWHMSSSARHIFTHIQQAAMPVLQGRPCGGIHGRPSQFRRAGACPRPTWSASPVGAHIVRPIMASPFQGEAVERSETDEGAHGDDGRSLPLPPHPSFAPQMPPSPLWGEGKGAHCAPLHGGGQVAPSSGPAGHLPPRGKVRRTARPGGRALQRGRLRRGPI